MEIDRQTSTLTYEVRVWGLLAFIYGKVPSHPALLLSRIHLDFIQKHIIPDR